MSATVYRKKLGEWGWRIEVQFVDSDTDAAIDVSTASAKKILWKTPANVIVSKDASFTTDGTDGKIEYTTTSADFGALGSYAIEAQVVLSTGKILSIEDLRVDVIQSLSAQAS